ncbi:TPA: amino acid permease [Staphylococcus aureus]|nr:amino acid permease [Staphylococcus aureus]
MGSFFNKIARKEDPAIYQNKDGHLKRTLRVRDFLALGVGTIVSTSIFTLPGIVAAQHAGPAVALSFLLAAIVAGLVAFTYAEMAAAMPFAGSAYSWVNVLFGEFFGWVAGWALLAEYFIAVAFVASGFSANLRGLVKPIGIELPAALSNPFGTNGGFIDIIAAIVILLTALLLSRGMSEAARMENILVILKVLAIILFVIVGLTAINVSNYVPFIPEHKVTATGDFGGWQGIYAGVSMIFLAYIGFDSIAANSAGTLVAFMFVSLAMYRLRKREGKDLPIPAFKLPLYPVLPAVTFVLVLLVFWGLGFEAKLYTLIWFIVGIILYLSYGLRHSKKNDVAEYHQPK